MAHKGGATAEPGRRPCPKWWQALVAAFAAIAAIGIGVYLYHRQSHGINPVPLQLAGSVAAAVRVICPPMPGCEHAFVVRTAGFRTALQWDLIALIPGYAAGLLLACGLGWRVFWRPGFQACALAGMAAAAAAAVFNVAQDALLLTALSGGPHGDASFRLAEALSLAKFSALLVAATIAILAITTTFTRLLGHYCWTRKRWEEQSRKAQCHDQRRLAIPPPRLEDGPDDGMHAFDPAWWRDFSAGSRTRWAQGFAYPSERPGNGIGICVSGGGIRSASVVLGALQAMRKAGVLGKADYIVSVSGGGYATGGIKLASTQASGNSPAASAAPVTKATPGDAFDRGSAEEDHLRRHSSYIADGAGQWLLALAVLLRGVLSSLAVIGLTITTLGLAIGKFYSLVPLADGGKLGCLRPKFTLTSTPCVDTIQKPPRAPHFPPVSPGILYAIGFFAALALVAFLLRQVAVNPGPERRISLTAAALLGATALVATIGVALPALLWASSWVTWPLGFDPLRAASLSSLSLLATYLGAVAGVFWRKRTTIAKSAGTITGLAKKGPVNQVLPNSMIQLIIMWICLSVLILASLLLCGWVATSGLANSRWALAPIGALAVLVIFIDQSTMSLHPFYRRRLASAFAVRRAEVDGVDVAAPYSYDEPTLLSPYAEPEPGKGFPAVTFAATANINGQHRIPPGRPAVPFMLAHDYIGGPATGWVRTDFLQELVGKRLQRDLTVEAAVAISGAAFASAMGSMTRFYEVFLAISNARLGAWLPNPNFVEFKLRNPGDWTIPGLPNRRRLNYFAREIFGIHPSTSRLLLCTDGGHYDNLGLVELLRRRCERIYCIDASAAALPLDDSLAAAITLAREELGVEIDLDAPLELVPGD